MFTAVSRIPHTLWQQDCAVKNSSLNRVMEYPNLQTCKLMLGVTWDVLITSLICGERLIIVETTSAHHTYTCLAINWGDVRYFFLHYRVAKLKCTQPCIVLEKSSPFSQQQSETVCLARSGSSWWRAHASIYTFTEYASSHKYTNAFGRMPHVKVCRCECVFMQLRLIGKWDDSVFIWSLSGCFNS